MIVIRKELCPQNHASPTLPLCPVEAILQEGFNAPGVDNEKCICCCKCVNNCAVFAPIGCCEDGPDPRLP